MRAARRAGGRAAMATTTITRMMTAPYVTGSSGVTPTSRVRTPREAAMATPSPNATPQRTFEPADSSTSRRIAFGVAPIASPYGELPAPVRDVERHQTEQSDSRQPERRGREEHQQPGRHPPRRRRPRHNRIHRRHIVDDHAGVKRTRVRLDRRDEAQRVRGRADDEVGRSPAHLEGRVVDVEQRLIEAAVPHIVHHADDGAPRGAFDTGRERRHREALADRVLTGPQPPGRAFPDDGHPERVLIVGLREETAPAQGNAHRVEISRRRDLVVQERIPLLVSGRFALAFEPDQHALANGAKRERPQIHGTGGLNGRPCGDPPQKLINPAIGGKRGGARLDVERHHVGRREPEIDVAGSHSSAR